MHRRFWHTSPFAIDRRRIAPRSLEKSRWIVDLSFERPIYRYDVCRLDRSPGSLPDRRGSSLSCLLFCLLCTPHLFGNDVIMRRHARFLLSVICHRRVLRVWLLFDRGVSASGSRLSFTAFAASAGFETWCSPRNVECRIIFRCAASSTGNCQLPGGRSPSARTAPRR